MGYTIDIDTGGTFTDGFFVTGNRVENEDQRHESTAHRQRGPVSGRGPGTL